MRLPMMSVYKLPIVIHALRLSERGRLDLSERVTLMPEDRRPNEAEFAADYHGLCCIADMRPFSLEKFAAMTERVPAEVRALAAKAYESDPRDTATPAGYATLLVRLYRRELLNEASTKWLLDLMQQMHARDGRIRAGAASRDAGRPQAGYLRPDRRRPRGAQRHRHHHFARRAWTPRHRRLLEGRRWNRRGARRGDRAGRPRRIRMGYFDQRSEPSTMSLLGAACRMA